MFVGGSFIAFGFLTMPVVIPLVVCMLLAIFMVEINRGFAPAEGGGMQVPVSLVAGLFVLLVTGPGPVSIDRLFGWGRRIGAGGHPGYAKACIDELTEPFQKRNRGRCSALVQGISQLSTSAAASTSRRHGVNPRFGCRAVSGTFGHTQRIPLDQRTSQPVQWSKGLCNSGTRPGKA